MAWAVVLRGSHCPNQLGVFIPAFLFKGKRMSRLRLEGMGRQAGFSMIEVAYVLPLMLIVILALVEAVNYASERYYLNNTLTDFYTIVMTEAQALASDPKHTSQLVSCASGKVRVDESQAAQMLRQMVLNVTHARADTLDIVAQKLTLMGIDTYVVDVSMPMQTHFLPPEFAKTFPLKAKMIISFALSCRSA